MLLQIKKGKRRAINLVECEERTLHNVAIKLVYNRRRDCLRADRLGIALPFDETILLPFATQKLAVKRSEKPGLHFRGIAQLVALRRPTEKRLLRQVGC